MVLNRYTHQSYDFNHWNNLISPEDETFDEAAFDTNQQSNYPLSALRCGSLDSTVSVFRRSAPVMPIVEDLFLKKIRFKPGYKRI